MMAVMAQLPGKRISDGAPLLLLGFDAVHAICVLENGTLVYIEMGDIIVDWLYDAKAEIWRSSTSTLEDLLLERYIETESAAAGGEAPESEAGAEPGQ